MIKTRKRLGDLLAETGLISVEQLEKALVVQKKTGERLGKVLVNLGYISEQEILEVLEYQLGIPRVNLAEIQISKEIAAVISVNMAERYKVIPVSIENGKLKLAMVDPTNFFAIDDIRMVSGYEIEPLLESERNILKAISQSYGVSELVEKAVNQLKNDEVINVTEVQTVDDAPIISIVNSIISQAVREKVSDIHIEPQDKDVRVRFRIDGMLREVINFPKHSHAALVSRIKIMSNMNIAEKRIPQDGRIKVQEGDREVDIRTSTLPTIRGEKVVMRILDKKAVILNVDKLGLSDYNLQEYKKLYKHSYGMILVTGPTGSGKTTTLYSTLTAVNSTEENIITVEDPVEYLLEGINQVQVNQKAGMTFASGLRSILRQDPNIVMVGEIRDGETADIAVRAALTGHLVLSTLHTNDAPGAIARLIDMGIEPFLIASSVLGVVAQRLIRVICPHCKEAYLLAEDAPERLILQVPANQPITLYRGKGCTQCNHTGYQGRMAIHEVMPISAKMRDIITSSNNYNLADIAKTEGMLTMAQDGINKALQGKTSIAEVMRVAYVDL